MENKKKVCKFASELINKKNKKMKKITLKNINDYSKNMNYSFSKPFLKIIKAELKDYSGTTKERLKGFLENMQGCGCQGGMIGKFIYNSDCLKFYIKHIEELEEYISELEESLGSPIKTSSFRYTQVVWFAFEEFCHDIYCNIFKKEEEEEE